MLIPLLLSILLLPVRVTSADVSIGELRVQQEALLTELRQTIRETRVLLEAYAQRGLTEEPAYLRLVTAEQTLAEIEQVELPKLVATLKAPLDSHERLDLQQAQAALLVKLNELPLTPQTPSASQEQALQRGEALKQLDDILNRQGEMLKATQHTEHTDRLAEEQRQLADATRSVMHAIAERNPDVAKSLQGSSQSMRLAERDLRRCRTRAASGRQRTAMDGLRTARRQLQANLGTDAAQREQVREKLRKLAEFGDLIEAQSGLRETIGGWQSDAPPRARLDAFRRQQELATQAQRMAQGTPAVESLLGEAKAAMEQSIEHLRQAAIGRAADDMDRAIESLRIAESQLAKGMESSRVMEALAEPSEQQRRSPLEAESRTALKEPRATSASWESPSRSLEAQLEQVDPASFPPKYAEILRRYYRRLAERAR